MAVIRINNLMHLGACQKACYSLMELYDDFNGVKLIFVKILQYLIVYRIIGIA